MRLPKHKLPKQSNKKIGRSTKHKQSEKSIARRTAKAAARDAKAERMENGEEDVKVERTEEEKAEAKAERKKANKSNVAYKHPPGGINVTARNGPRSIH